MFSSNNSSEDSSTKPQCEPPASARRSSTFGRPLNLPRVEIPAAQPAAAGPMGDTRAEGSAQPVQENHPEIAT